MSTLNVDKVDPSTGTALELGTSGDTITVPTGAGLTVVDEVKTNKVSPATGTAFALGDSGDTFTVPSGATIVNSGTATGFGITAASFRPNVQPLIINGDMKVAKRSVAATGITSDGYYATDRWKVRLTNGGTWSMYLNAGAGGDAAADGFPTSLWLDNTTADASLGAGDYVRVGQTIEAQNCRALKFGTANAETLTLGFWVYCTKTGTYIAELHREDSDRQCSQSYTISSSDTWEYKVLNFPADTTGIINDDNGSGLELIFWMGAGTNYTSGTLSTTWTSTTAANRAVGQVNAADSTSNNFQLGGVQLEVGTYTSATIPPFQHESYGDNLARCQRYYFKITQEKNNQAVCMGRYWSTTGGGGMFNFPVPMCGTVNPLFEGGTNYWTASAHGANDYFDGMTQNDFGQLTSGWYMSAGGGAPTLESGFIVMTNSDGAVAAWDSEL